MESSRRILTLKTRARHFLQPAAIADVACWTFEDTLSLVENKRFLGTVALELGAEVLGHTSPSAIFHPPTPARPMAGEWWMPTCFGGYALELEECFSIHRLSPAQEAGFKALLMIN
ncbi:hypothetical protein chiPu_0021376 [Chiloscyllium punctatum]|uniref:Uncharacterized protein n=1 Tax=Chiloscyllium punctatum TaxID=137246 RepID=A0A401RE79_CHIPU|nr:hypothetical protein [Chiloscyllium punctatum]